MTQKQTFILGLVIGIIFSMIIVMAALGDTAIVSWDKNNENDLSGYKVYYGTNSGSYDNIFDVGNRTSFPVNNLVIGTTYFFVVTAYDSSGNESGFSEEVNITIADTTEDPPTEDSLSFRAYCFPNPFSSQEGTTIIINIPNSGSLSIDIYTVTGRSMRNLINNLPIIKGEHHFKWDGKDEYGNSINPGIYFGVITLNSKISRIKMAVNP